MHGSFKQKALGLKIGSENWMRWGVTPRDSVVKEYLDPKEPTFLGVPYMNPSKGRKFEVVCLKL